MAGGMSLRQSAKESAKSASIVFISQTPVQEDIASPKVVEEWRGLRVVSPRRATTLAKEGPASTCLIKFWPVCVESPPNDPHSRHSFSPAQSSSP
jgi:hypothetical protein